MVRRSLTLSGHRTSLALEPEFWLAVERLAAAAGQPLAAYLADIDRARGTRNLASAVRLAVLAALESERAPDRQT